MAHQRGNFRVSWRQSLWFEFDAVSTTLAAAGNAVIQTSLNAAALALRPFTVVRTRGLIHLTSDQVVASEFQDVALGAIVLQEPAIAAGAGSVPTPVTEDASDWFVYERMMNDFLFFDATGVSVNDGRQRLVDSKAMRKVDLGMDIGVIVEASALSDGAIVTTYLRMLIKLH